MKAVHFGAGNIGRGFIGMVLSKAGYKVCFVDVNETLVSLLQQRGEYKVTLVGESRESQTVRSVTAIPGSDLPQVAEAVASAELVTTAVGVGVLQHIAGAIAQGLEARLQRTDEPLHIIACENAIGGSSILKEQVYARLSEETRGKADACVFFPNAAVDRIVPLQHNEDPLEVTVEPFFEWVVDRSAMAPGFRELAGVHYADRLEPYIERKLFTVNTGHCTAAYLGYLRGFETIQEAMADAGIAREVRRTLEETGALLVAKHGFDEREHQSYIDTIMERFRNPYLRDEVVRVGRSPIRKLSPEDRLIRPALQAFERGMKPWHLAQAAAAAFLFDYTEDPEAAELQSAIRTDGIGPVIARYTGIPEGHPVHALILKYYEQFPNRKDF